ncbi:hypothetical protein RNJ44_02423 [Nakaseomyces bracarensis]|uniref:Rab-GAP TBC domain-containing protein n=1 Tax=Nakaseomyces bracarensis TaxID=273131 RepID=A0ABR4NLP3_9SACH
MYTPPGKRLFQARHRVSRRDLQSDAFDWTTVRDEEVEGDLISYAVPVIGFNPPTHNLTVPETQSQMSQSQASSSSSSVFSVVPGGEADRYSNGTVDSLVEGLDPTLKYDMQRNISVDSLIQENNKRISEHRDSLALLKEYDTNERTESHRSSREYHQSGIELLETETKRELRRLRYENRTLLMREDVLTKQWAHIRQCPDDGALLLTLRKKQLYWFGIPADLRFKIYKLCLYSDRQLPSTITPESRAGLNTLYRLLRGDKTLAVQIMANINKEVPWLFNDGSGAQGSGAVARAPTQHTDVAVLETKLYGAFPGLYYHLRDKLQLNLFEHFMKPLLRTVLLKALSHNARDGVSLELLDILVVSLHYHELEHVLLSQMLSATLEQCHYKFFHSAIAHEISSTELDIVKFLETLRRPHADHLIST